MLMRCLSHADAVYAATLERAAMPDAEAPCRAMLDERYIVYMRAR